jgi:hypothetical protein
MRKYEYIQDDLDILCSFVTAINELGASGRQRIVGHQQTRQKTI